MKSLPRSLTLVLATLQLQDSGGLQKRSVSPASFATFASFDSLYIDGHCDAAVNGVWERSTSENEQNVTFQRNDLLLYRRDDGDDSAWVLVAPIGVLGQSLDIFEPPTPSSTRSSEWQIWCSASDASNAMNGTLWMTRFSQDMTSLGELWPWCCTQLLNMIRRSASGAPFYRADSSDRSLYFDPDCALGSQWILSGGSCEGETSETSGAATGPPLGDADGCDFSAKDNIQLALDVYKLWTLQGFSEALSEKQQLCDVAPTAFGAPGERMLIYSRNPDDLEDVAKGRVIEGAVRDDEGKSQGTMLMDGVATDCQEAKKQKVFHFEKFKVLGTKELSNKVPAWAFGRTCSKVMNAFLKEREKETPAEGEEAELPWREPGEEESESSAGSEHSDKKGLKEQLIEARNMVKALEKRLSKKDKGKDKKEKEKKEKRPPRRAASSGRRKKRRAGSPGESGEDKKKEKKKRSHSSGNEQRKKKKVEEKRDTSSSRSDSGSSGGDGLF
eukprot:s332_g38.t1